ncbi:hypothetical protein [Streptomyces sp. NPDC005407]|uniref:hypothetical protein n=1 Tax=Streptomyces sp. NPDC005407 TaxID=3155340 RepID=UPI0033BDE451
MDAGDDTAARRLRVLEAELHDPWRTPGEQEGSRSVRPAGRGSRTVHSPALIHLGILEHMTASRAEVIARARAEVPDTGPDPGLHPGMYTWWRERTAHLAPEIQQARETVIYRQSLEHAIAAGDTKVIRPHPCPDCGCFGLEWDSGRRRAICTYRPCSDERGMTHAWKLAELAHRHVAGEKMLKSNAT